MRRPLAAVAALGLAVATAGCSGDKSTEPVTVADGTVNGSDWRLVTFRNSTGDLCLEIRDGDGKPGDGFGSACGGWASSNARHDQDPYMDGPGPAGSEFAFGPLSPAVTVVEASAPGRKTLVTNARPLPQNAGAAKFFVIPFPDATTTWTYIGKNGAGAAEPLGLQEAGSRTRSSD
jgi:hypothetical protein